MLAKDGELSPTSMYARKSILGSTASLIKESLSDHTAGAGCESGKAICGTCTSGKAALDARCSSNKDCADGNKCGHAFSFKGGVMKGVNSLTGMVTGPISEIQALAGTPEGEQLIDETSKKPMCS